jgi:hypothetical protein
MKIALGVLVFGALVVFLLGCGTAVSQHTIEVVVHDPARRLAARPRHRTPGIQARWRRLPPSRAAPSSPRRRIDDPARSPTAHHWLKSIRSPVTRSRLLSAVVCGATAAGAGCSMPTGPLDFCDDKDDKVVSLRLAPKSLLSERPRAATAPDRAAWRRPRIGLTIRAAGQEVILER